MLAAMRENYARCEAEVRAHDKDRYLATLFAPLEARPHWSEPLAQPLAADEASASEEASPLNRR